MAIETNLSDTIGPFIIWQLLIPLAAGWIQSILYAIFIRAGDPKPQPGSARYIKHRRNIILVVYAAYFLFTIYEVDHHLQLRGTAYTDLGVPVDVTDSGVNSRFRKLTVRFHPDKVGPGVDREKANDYYVHLKHARDIVLDPAKRFAYDRFGPNILRQCQSCLTVRDYVKQSSVQILATYGPLAVMLLSANVLGFLKDGAYWRYLALLALTVYELRTALRPDHPPFLNYTNTLITSAGVRPAYLPFQATSLIRKAALSLAQFLGAIAPLFADPNKPATPAEDNDEARHKQIDRLEALMGESGKDANRLLDLEVTPFRGDDGVKRELRDAMKKWMIQNIVHSEKEVRNRMGEVLARKRMGVPAGARGNR